MKEIYKEVEDFPGYYISNHGKVLSKKQSVKEGGKQLLVHETGKVKLRKEGISYTIAVSRLVAAHFLADDRNGRNRVSHHDGDILNNKVTNLYWSGLSASDVSQIRNYLKEKYSYGELARMFGVSPKHVKRIEEGEVWKDED